jgi:hypothetical protein
MNEKRPRGEDPYFLHWKCDVVAAAARAVALSGRQRAARIDRAFGVPIADRVASSHNKVGNHAPVRAQSSLGLRFSERHGRRLLRAEKCAVNFLGGFALRISEGVDGTGRRLNRFGFSLDDLGVRVAEERFVNVMPTGHSAPNFVVMHCVAPIYLHDSRRSSVRPTEGA